MSRLQSTILSKHRFLRAAVSATIPPSRMGPLAIPGGEGRSLSQCPHLSISEAEDDPEVRTRYRPFLLDATTEATDWISKLELETAIAMAEADLAKTKTRLRVLVLYGSLRKR
jgi:arsenic resistance protein ArsH